MDNIMIMKVHDAGKDGTVGTSVALRHMVGVYARTGRR
jgi:hypothetical protein